MSIALLSIKKKGTKGGEDIKAEFSHLVEKVPDTKEGMDKRIHEIVDVLCEKMDIKVKPDLEINNNYIENLETIAVMKEAGASRDAIDAAENVACFVNPGNYNFNSQMIDFDKSFLQQKTYRIKTPLANGDEFFYKDTNSGADAFFPEYLVQQIKKKEGHFYNKIKEVDPNLNNVEFIEMTDKDKLLAATKQLAHELDHRAQQEMIMGRESHSTTELYEKLVEEHGVPVDFVSRGRHKAKDFPADFIKKGTKEYEQANEFYDAIYKMMTSSQEDYLNGYEQNPLEVHAFKFQQDFAKNHFSEMFGCTQEEALRA